jgi:futalosine hydrolase
MRVLIITAVPAEARAIGELPGCVVVAGGIGRTNAAAATTESILRCGPFDAVISAGVAGALPGGGLALGDAILADACVYVEEGLVTPDGFVDIEGMGFALGSFAGNVVPVSEGLRRALSSQFATGPMATVATCSGTDEAAAEVVRRTGARAEAMEGAAVVHAALRLGVDAIELRTISNTTGDRPRQQWDLGAALRGLGPAVARAIRALASAG